MAIRIAIAGFRHGHIYDVPAKAKDMQGVRIVASCEEDPAARKGIAEKGLAAITHDSISRMLDEVECDAVAVGDYYGKRGKIVIEALTRGKHVITDKPVCTGIAELDAIERLCREKGLKLGCMLDMRDSGRFIGARRLITDGRIGEIHGIHFGGQHPLAIGVRPGWYFEPGKHGGTINDISIHAIDGLPWMTGIPFMSVIAARTWNAFAKNYPHFMDAGQMMLTMRNGCGVLGDVSYFMPDSQGYTVPQYWRMTFFGTQGILETSATSDTIMLALNGEKTVKAEPPPAGNPGGYLKAFLDDIAGNTKPDALTTASVIHASRTALLIQNAADKNLRDIPL